MKSTRKKHRIRLIVCLLTVVMISMCIPCSVSAETTLEKLQKAKEEKAKTQEAVGNTKEKKESLKITQNSLLGKLSQLNDDLTLVSNNLQKIEDDIASKEADIANTQAELEEALLTEQNQYESMKIRIKYVYERGNDAYLELLLSAKSFGDFLNKSEYIERLSRYDQKMLEEFRTSRQHVEEVKAELENELSELSQLKEQTQTEQQKVSSLVQTTANNVASYADQIEDAEETIGALETMLSQQDQNIAALQKQYEEELALSRLAAKSAWRDISEVTFEEGDRRLLANLIYCEAGGEPYAGKLAVGAVVINRVLSSRYPNTVVGVIYQNKQFSPVASGRLALALAQEKATASCYQAADEAMSGMTNVGQCVYFRTPIEGLTGISIGGHIFY